MELVTALAQVLAQGEGAPAINLAGWAGFLGSGGVMFWFLFWGLPAWRKEMLDLVYKAIDRAEAREAIHAAALTEAREAYERSLDRIATAWKEGIRATAEAILGKPAH